ncbi:hypothetical protein [Mycobacterium haemophilum]|uniref:Uncharacterized protein n=1 Tax=Mycobacterium haemophilum TaxID=29311 RepID=A0A0I9UJD3_9MYCO|nr:hypothetical protein [Mycobacterium haemophilum]KLO31263.1 hypothetical protein ABH39_09480 [Mycobacterium haemophilum]KLO36185.1 hypothetical protein ABH38_13400 [Mycobacterium haemophilum]KLO42033.1 hypothetical protein ABH37_12030 [Mycobacterium haemophilum]KLO49944.1 hypothetical protein ABH36_09950 [Mycobacterium haemophilum]
MATDPDTERQDGDHDKYACWYQRTESLSQGTVVRDIRVFEEAAEYTESEPRMASRRIDAIVLTQTCDIQKPAQNRLLIAEVRTYRDFATQRGGHYRSTQYRKESVAGLTLSEFLLPPAQLALDDWSIVNFRELYTIDRDRLKSDNGFITLDSPYIEHLGQAFARFIMRVGLPTGLDEFEKFQL